MITLAMNMVSHGLDPQLDMRNMRELRATAEYCNQLPVIPAIPMRAIWYSRLFPAAIRMPSTRA